MFIIYSVHLFFLLLDLFLSFFFLLLLLLLPVLDGFVILAAVVALFVVFAVLPFCNIFMVGVVVIVWLFVG